MVKADQIRRGALHLPVFMKMTRSGGNIRLRIFRGCAEITESNGVRYFVSLRVFKSMIILEYFQNLNACSGTK